MVVIDICCCGCVGTIIVLFYPCPTNYKILAHKTTLRFWSKGTQVSVCALCWRMSPGLCCTNLVQAWWCNLILSDDMLLKHLDCSVQAVRFRFQGLHLLADSIHPGRWGVSSQSLSILQRKSFYIKQGLWGQAARFVCLGPRLEKPYHRHLLD